jgi:WD40 repeat protein
MLVEQPQAHPGGQAIKSLSLAPDGHLLATCSKDKSIKLWDVVATGKLVRVIEEEKIGFYTPTFSKRAVQGELRHRRSAQGSSFEILSLA